MNVPSRVKQLGLITVVAAAAFAGLFLAGRNNHPTPQISPTESAVTPTQAGLSITPQSSPAVSTRPQPNTSTSSRPLAIPKSYLIKDVPFIEQAPLKNWDAVHEETCEEAAALTVVHYLKGDTTVPAQQIEDELQAAIVWETDHFGSYEDETAAQTAQLLRDYYGLGTRVRLINNATVEDLKRELVAGHPVIAPTAGRLLGNKYFKKPGPIYHMTVAIGYNANSTITNDPGTQHGKNYHYPINQFWDAVHGFVDRTDAGMASGEKILIVIDPA